MKKILMMGVIAVFACLAGCVSMREPQLSGAQTHFSVQTRQAIVEQLTQMNTWQADGAFSFESKNQVGIANFRIDVTPYTWRVQISSSLNLMQMTMGSDALGVWYTDQHGHIQHAQSLETVMKAQFGFALPIETLIGWMKGLSMSDQAAVTLNRFNQLSALEENGWTLHYFDYGLHHQVSLPGMITIMGYGEKVKMMIREWH